MRILYIDIDSLCPHHLGCYGYHRPTSPAIDSIARRGVRFNQYFCSDSPCVPSRAALFSGRPGIQNGVVAHENTPAGATMRYGNRERGSQAPMLAHHLAHAGYHTVSFSSFANRHLAGWFHFGFREFHLDSLKNGNEDAPELNAVALPWLEQNAKRDNWFAHLNYWDPHTLYTEPLPYMHMMAEYPAPPWPDTAEIERQNREDLGIRTARDLWAADGHEKGGANRPPTMPAAIRDRRDFEQLINGYDGAIRYCDDHIAQVLEMLDRQGVLEETAIIISADHAESFGELGQYMEHGSASPAVQHVPLIVKWPGLTDSFGGASRDELLLNIDFAPTIADALGLSIPPGWAGLSFIDALRGKSAQPRDTIVWGHGLHTRQRAVYDGRWLFIRTYHPSYYLYPPRMLFDLQTDPNQAKNLANERPDRTATMEAALLEWEEQMLSSSAQADPLQLIQHEAPCIIGSPQAYLKRVEDAGRRADAERLRRHYASISEDYGWSKA